MEHIAAGPAEGYRAHCAEGVIRPDPAQQRVVDRLQRLHDGLIGYQPPPKHRGLLSLLHVGNGNGATKPRGIYLVGPVGRGKSMLMDLFFAAAPVAAKRRVHFHAFMLEVHNRMEVERRAIALCRKAE